MRKFLSAKALIGLALLLTVIAVAVLAPFFIPPERATQMVMSARLQPPSLEYPLGTDQLGRDLLARVMLGAQTSLMIAVLAVGMSIVLGLPLG
ncbi:MAG: ABC transporter permease, partial [Roseicyclus sp.]